MDIYKRRHIESNEKYREYEHTIDSIQNAIRREIPQLIQEFQLSVEETTSLNEFINDRATMFRFLRKNNYSLPTSLSLLLDTIRWRILSDIDNFCTSTVRDYLIDPLVYFHKTDKINRPVLIVNLCHLPKAPIGSDVAEFLTPLVIFVLETARLFTWDITQQRVEAGLENPLVLDTLVLIEFQNAKSLPMDISLLKSFVTLMRRYPGLTGTVQLINFGWMYQGLWQMCKLVLSDEAKAKVNFPKLSDLKLLIEEEDLLADFGGKDLFKWDITIDPYYTKYRGTLIFSSPHFSRRNSTSSIYYDAIEPLSRPPSSLYATPITSLTPVASHANLTSIAKTYSSLTLQSKLGNAPRLRTTIKTLGDLFVATTPTTTTNDLVGGVPFWILSEKLNAIQKESETIPFSIKNNRKPPPWIYRLWRKLQDTARYLTLRILKKMVKYRGTLYWVVACILLRNGVQELIENVFMLMMQVFINSSSAGNAVGLRSVLGLTTGQMTL